ncbi:MAG: nitroreductase family protein [Lachnospiraceae bacterium]|nr:nitroreductase family protein [Lachnospiraceae bacterium]
MNAIMENLLTRRSCRSFLAKPIPEDQLQDILKAACYAPSGRGLQTWQFTAVTDRSKIQRLASVIKETLGRDGYNMYDPQVIILPSNETDSPYGKEDNACALENIFLAAHSYGIGSVWINQLQGICEEPIIRAILTEFGIPENHTVYGLAALGYPAMELPKDVSKKGLVKIVT